MTAMSPPATIADAVAWARDRAACSEGLAWLGAQSTPEQAWASCPRGDWLAWWLRRARPDLAPMLAPIRARCADEADAVWARHAAEVAQIRARHADELAPIYARHADELAPSWARRDAELAPIYARHSAEAAPLWARGDAETASIYARYADEVRAAISWSEVAR